MTKELNLMTSTSQNLAHLYVFELLVSSGLAKDTRVVELHAIGLPEIAGKIYISRHFS